MTDQTTQLTDEESRELLALLEEKNRRETYDKFHNYYFQDYKIDHNGHDISRYNYQPHLKMFKATKDYKEVAFVAANRVGKSEAGAFLIAALVMKDYPTWWEGRKFPEHEPLKIMVLGKTNMAVRDVAQKKLVGTLFNLGTGMIPLADENDPTSVGIVEYRKKCGTPDALQDLYVRDKFGCVNHIQFMSSEIDEDVVMGQELHVAWFDEECLKDRLYQEIYIRTMTTQGFIFNTFTPLNGITQGIMRFMPNLSFPEDGIVRDQEGNPLDRFVVHCGWDDAPHLTDKEKDRMMKGLVGPDLISRTKGIPTVGAGQIYPLMEDEYTVEPFNIPAYWPKVYGMDFGWNKTAAVWGAIDPNTDVVYIYSEYYQGHDVPAVHAEGIKARGSWLIGVCDPAGGRKTNDDGTKTLDLYKFAGLNLVPANNAVEAGILTVYQRLAGGGLKIMKNCKNLIEEARVYRRDDNGKIIKEKDHLLDSLRYLIMSGLDYATVKPDDDFEPVAYQKRSGCNSITGY